ncbi:ribonuclease H [Sesbania bispinosa]|nr:ribonuclease H [Sesbania bispinosa]
MFGSEGVPLLHNRPSRATFDYIIQKTQQRLSSWRANSLAFVGRVTLGKSVLAALPTYTIQTMLLPKSVCNELEQMHRNFIWNSLDSRSWYSVSWDKVCRAVRVGGLGFKSLYDFNQAMIMKLGSKESLAWRGIQLTWDIVVQGLRWVIGDGGSTRFWEDRWLHSGLLLRDACLVPFQDIWSTALVRDFADPIQGWNLNTLHGLFPADVVAEIVALPCPNPSLGPDFVCWGGTPNGKFSTKTAYTLIESSFQFVQDPIWRVVWKWEGHQRARCLLWMILNNGLKTRSKGFS